MQKVIAESLASITDYQLIETERPTPAKGRFWYASPPAGSVTWIPWSPWVATR
ncbi:hypothetical protein [Alloalcanivorax balearicus]|uniref:hypothetical protein n=1 Tax=Alloalcanivorax balearicus TaxID=413232 RepID=UPI0021CD2869|nr:hypothetical protein [Alloalcanivorax balearicus]